jgi:hypothetical protein
MYSTLNPNALNLHQQQELLCPAGHSGCMPLYRFHIRNDIDAPDEEGEHFDNLAAAHLRAIDYARDLASAAVRQGRLDRKHRIDVEDEDGKVLVTVTFADAVEVLN